MSSSASDTKDVKEGTKTVIRLKTDGRRHWIPSGSWTTVASLDRHVAVPVNLIYPCDLLEMDRSVSRYNHRQPYAPKNASDSSCSAHIGQRKLLLSEIEFLTRHWTLSRDVVYAGAAPGIHIPVLSDMFPSHRFHLYDSSVFHVRATDFILLNKRRFEDSDCKLWSQQPCIFISDIRTLGAQSPVPDESDVRNDMELQRNWVLKIKPRASMLKFRLPWDKGFSEYLDGELRFQAYAPKRSTETRLWVTDPASFKMSQYDHCEYEEKLSHYNQHFRGALHPRTRLFNQGRMIDRCGDCAVETLIIKEYIKTFSISELCPKTWKFCDLVSFFSEWFDSRLLLSGSRGLYY
jgi:hypothetical protein